jgi:hypothetical protein
MNPYTLAFAVGYFYGRNNSPEDVVLPEHDIYYRANQGFADGLEIGRRDFQDIDLPIIALDQPQVE